MHLEARIFKMFLRNKINIFTWCISAVYFLVISLNSKLLNTQIILYLSRCLFICLFIYGLCKRRLNESFMSVPRSSSSDVRGMLGSVTVRIIGRRVDLTVRINPLMSTPPLQMTVQLCIYSIDISPFTTFRT